MTKKSISLLHYDLDTRRYRAANGRVVHIWVDDIHDADEMFPYCGMLVDKENPSKFDQSLYHFDMFSIDGIPEFGRKGMRLIEQIGPPIPSRMVQFPGTEPIWPRSRSRLTNKQLTDPFTA